MFGNGISRPIRMLCRGTLSSPRGNHRMTNETTESPYFKYLGVESEAPDHYRLLGLQHFAQSPALIRAAAEAARERLLDNRPEEDLDRWQQICEEVDSAERRLLDSEIKQIYDDALRSALKSTSGSGGSPGATTPGNGSAPIAKLMGPAAGSPPPPSSSPLPPVESLTAVPNQASQADPMAPVASAAAVSDPMAPVATPGTSSSAPPWSAPHRSASSPAPSMPVSSSTQPRGGSNSPVPIAISASGSSSDSPSTSTLRSRRKETSAPLVVGVLATLGFIGLIVVLLIPPGNKEKDKTARADNNPPADTSAADTTTPDRKPDVPPPVDQGRPSLQKPPEGGMPPTAEPNAIPGVGPTGRPNIVQPDPEPEPEPAQMADPPMPNPMMTEPEPEPQQTPDPMPQEPPPAEPMPAEPPESTATPEQIEAMRKELKTAVTAMVDRDLETAEKALKQAEELAVDPAMTATAANYRLLYDAVEGFWEAVREGITSIVPGEELVISDIRMFVVDVKPNEVTIRIQGRNRTYKALDEGVHRCVPPRRSSRRPRSGSPDVAAGGAARNPGEKPVAAARGWAATGMTTAASP